MGEREALRRDNLQLVHGGTGCTGMVRKSWSYTSDQVVDEVWARTVTALLVVLGRAAG